MGLPSPGNPLFWCFQQETNPVGSSGTDRRKMLPISDSFWVRLWLPVPKSCPPALAVSMVPSIPQSLALSTHRRAGGAFPHGDFHFRHLQLPFYFCSLFSPQLLIAVLVLQSLAGPERSAKPATFLGTVAKGQGCPEMSR